MKAWVGFQPLLEYGRFARWNVVTDGLFARSDGCLLVNAGEEVPASRARCQW